MPEWLQTILKRTTYKIISDPDVAIDGGIKWKNVPKSLLRNNDSEPIDDNKYQFIFGNFQGRQEVENSNGFDYTEYLNRYYPGKDIKSYQGIINPWNEYIIPEQFKGLVEELAKHSKHVYQNSDREFEFDSGPDKKYRDDVANYIQKFIKTPDGITISASDLYDFEPKHYAESYAHNNENAPGALTMILQSKLLNLVGNPYILRQDNIPIKFIGNGATEEELYRTEGLINGSTIFNASDEDIAKEFNTGFIPAAEITAKISKDQHGNKILNKWQQLYDSKFGKIIRDAVRGTDSDLSNEEYLQKHGYYKPVGGLGAPTMVLAPEWEGLEFPEITAMHYGLKGASKGTSAVETARFMNVPRKVNEAKSINNWQKFLQKSTQEKNDIVRMWNAERYSDFPQLERSKDLNKFINWLNKQ